MCCSAHTLHSPQHLPTGTPGSIPARSQQLTVTSSLVDCLIDPDPDIRQAAAQTIWATVHSRIPANNGLTFALCCLRNEIQECEIFPFMGAKPARQALMFLQEAQPDRQLIFKRHLIYAWCHTESTPATYGYKLLDIYSEYGTFLGAAKQICRQVGRELLIIDRDSTATLCEAIQLVLGETAAHELYQAWASAGLT